MLRGLWRLSLGLITSEYTKNEASKALGKNKGKDGPHEPHKYPRNVSQIKLPSEQ
jgi:hypothetical protein